MTSIVFPASLPCPEQGSRVDEKIDPWVSDNVEVGASRRRKRYTRSIHRFSFTLRLKSDQVAVLNAFYVDDLDDGIEAFKWTHPSTAKVYNVRFDGAPKLQHLFKNMHKATLALTEI